MSEDTLRRILTVLAEDATPESAGEDERIAPIHVVRIDDPVIVPVRDLRPPQSVAWRLELEDGGVRTGTSGLRVSAQADVAEVSIPGELPLGYHRLVLIRADNPWADTTLAIVPRECYRPPALQARARLWGPMLQLYALRSERQWGIGDFTDLADAAEMWHERGAGLFGVSPLHALFPHHPEHASPYSPSSRRFLNVLFIDVEAVPEFAVCADAQRRVASPPFQRRLRRLRASPQVEYSGVAACKLPILRRLFRVFRDREWYRDTRRARRFRAFRAMHGAALRQQALFDALARQVRTSRPQAHGWLDWPAELRAPSTAAAQAFAAEHPDRFFEFYIAEQQMIAAAVGLQVRGLTPYAATFAAFLTRAYDFIRMAAVSRADINLVGSHAGVSIGEDGPSQMGLEDIAALRAVHGSVVLHPSDANSAARLTAGMAEHNGVSYLRTLRGKTPVLYGPEEGFRIGGSKVLRSSAEDRVAVVAAGATVHEALAAADALAGEGVAVRVVDAYSVKPVDAATLRTAAEETGRIVTVEDHWPEGGLGDAVLDVFADTRSRPRTMKLAVSGMPASATPEEQLREAGIDAGAIEAAVRGILRQDEAPAAAGS